MDHNFLNASNTPSSFSNDLQTAEKLYFTHDREQIFTDESADSDEKESSNSEEEPDNNTESLGPKIEWTECDVNDRQKVESFMKKGFGCSHGSEGKNCSKHYSVEQILDHRQICLEMTSSELDMVILAQFDACTRQDDISFSSRQRRKRKKIAKEVRVEEDEYKYQMQDNQEENPGTSDDQTETLQDIPTDMAIIPGLFLCDQQNYSSLVNEKELL